MSLGLIGDVFVLSVASRMFRDRHGHTHRLAKVHTTKASAHEHAKTLKKNGKQVKILEGKDKNGKPIYGVYTRVVVKKKKKTK
jgi:hypothetical protein